MAAERRRRGHADPWGPGISIPTDNGAEIEALAGSNPSFAAWEQNEPYTIALLIKGRSGGGMRPVNTAVAVGEGMDGQAAGSC